MAKSIMQEGRFCYVCERSGIPLEEHHVMNGNPNRKLSEKYGLKVYLCPECHKEAHADFTLREHLKQRAQRQAMKQYGWTVEDFRRIFGKNYL